MNNLAFVEAARGFLGVPWVHQGRTERGMDCVGLVVLAMRRCGVNAPLDATYGRMQDYLQARRYLDQFCVRVGQATVGDIILFKTKSTLHMAIVSQIDNDKPSRVIQALGYGSKVVDTGLSFIPMQLWRIRWPS